MAYREEERQDGSRAALAVCADTVPNNRPPQPQPEEEEDDPHVPPPHPGPMAATGLLRNMGNVPLCNVNLQVGSRPEAGS